jgi:hypothetical protein
MNRQTIDDIIARFGRAGWLVQKTDKNYWTVRPKGLYNHKLYLLIYNPFDDKYQLVPPPTPHDVHYERALKILRAGDRCQTADCHLRCISDLFIIKVKSMFPVKISVNKWINLADVREASIQDNGNLFVIWSSGESTTFEQDEAKIVFQAITEAYKVTLKYLASTTA